MDKLRKFFGKLFFGKRSIKTIFETYPAQVKESFYETMLDESGVEAVFKKYPAVANRYFFEGQSKPEGLENYTYAFCDSNGKKYYILNSDSLMHMTRKAQLDMALEEFHRRLTSAEIAMVADGLKKEINDIIGNKDPNITADILTRIYQYAEDLDRRERDFIHPVAYWNLVAMLYLREDENPKIFDEEVHKQKAEQFKKDAESGLSHFFFTTKLNGFIPGIGAFQDNLIQSLEAGKQALKKHTDLFRSLKSDESTSDTTT